MIKAIVLGANGYIARNLVYVMKRDHKDYEITLYGRETESADGYENYHCVDMSQREAIRGIDLSCDIIFMLVGKTGTANGFEDYDSFIDTNERTLLNLLAEYRVQQSEARIVFPSTRLVYKGKEGPQKEDAEKEFKTVYAINKFACEQYLEQYRRAFGVPYTILRICVSYGTFVKGASSYGTIEFMLSKAVKGENITLYGDGSVRRTLTYMGDLCTTMIDAALSENCANGIFNVGGEDYSLKEMAELIATRYGVGVEYVSWPVLAKAIESGDTVFDATALDTAIGRKNSKCFMEWIENLTLPDNARG